MVTKVLKILLLLSPIAYLNGVHLQQFDIQFFHIGVMALFGASLLDKPVREFPRANKLAGGLIGLMLLNIGLHRMNPVVSINCSHILLAMVALFIIVRYVREPKQLYFYIILPAVINICVFTLQRVGVDLIFNAAADPGGLMGNAPRLMTYLGIVLPFMWFGLGFLFITCISCAVAGTEVTLLASAMVMLMFKTKHVVAKDVRIACRIGLVAVSAIACYVFRDSIITSLANRLETWKGILVGFFAQPIAGFGLGIFPYKEEVAWIVPAEHTFTIYSSFLQFITGIGIAGFIWLFFVLKKYKSHFTLTPASLSILSLTIFCLVEYPIEIHRIWLTIISIVGIFIIESKQKECADG